MSKDPCGPVANNSYLETEFSNVHVNVNLIPHIQVSHMVSFQGWVVGSQPNLITNVYLPAVLHRIPVFSVFLIYVYFPQIIVLEGYTSRRKTLQIYKRI